MNINPYRASVHSYKATSNDITATELEAFAGGEHYPRVLLKLLEGQASHGGFNIWAALFGTQWFFFRKLYLFGLFAFAIEAMAPIAGMIVMRNVSTMAANDVWAVSVIVCFLAGRIVFGYMANIALCLKAVAVIEEVDALNKDNETHLRLIRVAGGVSMGSLFLIWSVLAMLRIMTR